jgi:chemotaxis protein methyltransferase CheR
MLPSIELEAEQREFPFGDKDYERVRQLIYRRAGIALGDTKRDLVYSRLARRIRARRLRSFADYLALLDRDDAPEWEEFTNALTTNLTSFFREPHHFEILARFLAKRGFGRPIRLWCCAASTGEEPYSIAMTAVEAMGNFDVPVSILATDVDTQVLAKAARGVYPLDRLERMSQDRLRTFFRKGQGAQTGLAKVRDELRDLIEFRPLNLLDRSWDIEGGFDAIFCRNVMIYFDKPTQERLLRRLEPLLDRHGLLFVGHSETLFHVADIFESKGRTVYRKAPIHAP